MSRQHGTRAKYVVDKCRCESCREANRACERERNRLQAYGRWEPYTDAQPARAHVKALGAQGMGWKRVAGAAGLSTSVVWKLLYGDPKRNQQPSKRVRHSTADALLAVKLNLGDHSLIAAAGTRRRLQALVCLGYSQSNLAGRLSIGGASLNHTLHHSPTVLKATADKVARLYDELAMTPNTPTERWARSAATRARNYATWMMWLAPLAWDDDTIDDPFSEPERVDESLGGVDEIAVQRALDGDRTVPLAKAERAEVVRRWVADGRPLSHLERDLGIHSHRYLGTPA